MTLFGNFVPNGGLQNTRAVLGKNGFHFQKMLLKLWIFSPNEVKVINQLSLLLVCHLCHRNNWPYLEFLTDIIALSGIFVKNWHNLFGVFPRKYGTNSWHTPCTPHIEVPPPPSPPVFTMNLCTFEFKQTLTTLLFQVIRLWNQIMGLWEAIRSWLVTISIISYQIKKLVPQRIMVKLHEG